MTFTAPPTSFCETALWPLLITLMRAQHPPSSATSLVRRLGAPSVEANPSSLATMKDCASTFIRHQQLLFRMPRHAPPPCPVFSLYSIFGLWRPPMHRTLMALLR